MSGDARDVGVRSASSREHISARGSASARRTVERGSLEGGANATGVHDGDTRRASALGTYETAATNSIKSLLRGTEGLVGQRPPAMQISMVMLLSRRDGLDTTSRVMGALTEK